MALRDAVEAGKALKLDEMSETQQEVEAWIAAVTGKPFDAPFAEHLHDGRVLCELMNVIEPGSVKKINSSKLAFKQMENVSNFTRAMKKLGVRETDCFDTIDLFEAHDIAKVSASRRGPRIGLELATRARSLRPQVLQSLESLGGVVQKLGKYKGPQLGVVVKDATKREFTSEQLAKTAAETAGSKLTAGSSATMERSETTKQGITFGNAMAGSGEGGEISSIAMGSAGVMERSETTKQGITFGNSMAGAGAAGEVSSIATGSAGVMERTETTKQGITFGNAASS